MATQDNIKLKNEHIDECVQPLEKNPNGIQDYADTFEDNSESFDDGCEEIDNNEIDIDEGDGNYLQKSDPGDWKCSLCEKYFHNEDNAWRHMKSVHEEKLDFKCNQCEKEFSRFHALKRHVEIVHDIKKVSKMESHEQIKCQFI